MSVVKVYKHFRDETAEFSADSTKLTQLYTVQFDNKTWTRVQAATATDGTTAVPALGSMIEGIPVVRTSVKKQENGYFADVVCECEPSTSETPGAGSDAKWEVEYSVAALPWKKQVYKDLDNKQFINSAEQKYDDKFEVDMYDEEITVRFKARTLDHTNIQGCLGKLNTAAVTVSSSTAHYSRTFDAKKLRFVKPQYQITFGNYGEQIWQVAYVFEYRADWKLYVVDKGFCHFVWTGNDEEFGTRSTVRNRDGNGEFLTTPQYLDGSGKLLAAGENAVYFPTEGFRMIDDTSFTGLFTGLV